VEAAGVGLPRSSDCRTISRTRSAQSARNDRTPPCRYKTSTGDPPASDAIYNAILMTDGRALGTCHRLAVSAAQPPLLRLRWTSHGDILKQGRSADATHPIMVRVISWTAILKHAPTILAAADALLTRVKGSDAGDRTRSEDSDPGRADWVGWVAQHSNRRSRC
jgi:hypothetical protein